MVGLATSQLTVESTFFFFENDPWPDAMRHIADVSMGVSFQYNFTLFQCTTKRGNGLRCKCTSVQLTWVRPL